MKRLLNKISGRLADAALLEMGVDVVTTEGMVAAEPKEGVLAAVFRTATDSMADAAMLEEGIDIFSNCREAEKVSKRRSEQETVHPDECKYGDGDLCFRRAA